MKEKKEVEEKEEEKERYVECLANLFHSKIKSTESRCAAYIYLDTNSDQHFMFSTDRQKSVWTTCIKSSSMYTCIVQISLDTCSIVGSCELKLKK